MKTESFTVSVRLNALVSFSVPAQTLEAALETAKRDLNETAFYADGLELIDSAETIIGVDAPWEL